MRHPILAHAAKAFAVTAALAGLAACSGNVNPSVLPAGADRQTQSGRALPGDPGNPGDQNGTYNAGVRPLPCPSFSPAPLKLAAVRHTESGRPLPGGGDDGSGNGDANTNGNANGNAMMFAPRPLPSLCPGFVFPFPHRP